MNHNNLATVEHIPDETPQDLYERQSEAIFARISSLGGREELVADRVGMFIKEKGIDAEFFENPENAVVMTMLADKYERSGDENDREFVESALAILASKHSVELARRHTMPGDTLSSATERLVYERFTDKKLSSELKTAISNGLLDSVKAQLGVTVENEDPYEIRVLNILDEGDATSSYGIKPRVNWDNEDREEIDSALAEMSQIDEWLSGLHKRAEEFKSATGEKRLAPAWVTVIDEKVTLCVPSVIAERVLNPSITSSGYHNEPEMKRNQAAIFGVLEHEYVHTQAGMNANHEIGVGIVLEELRAEMYSGDKNGYQDIKAFGKDFGVVTGKNLVDYLVGEKGGSAANVYIELANDIGIDRALDVLLMRPVAYARNESATSESNKVVDGHIGGGEGVIARLIEESPNQAAIVERAKLRVNKLLGAFDNDKDRLRDVLESMIVMTGQVTVNRLYISIIDSM